MNNQKSKIKNQKSLAPLAFLLSMSCAVAARAESPADAFAAADALFHQGAYEEAVAAYRAFAAQFPEDWRAAQARFSAAFILQKKLKRPEQAREEYETVIRSNSASPLARHAQYHIAEAYEQDGQTQKAIGEYQKFLKKFARHARARGVEKKLEFLGKLNQGETAERPGWAYKLERKQWRKNQSPLEPGEKRVRNKPPAAKGARHRNGEGNNQENAPPAPQAKPAEPQPPAARD
jgi:tetratricopeptide (TPR) repeat protein